MLPAAACLAQGLNLTAAEEGGTLSSSKALEFGKGGELAKALELAVKWDRPSSWSKGATTLSEDSAPSAPLASPEAFRSPQLPKPAPRQLRSLSSRGEGGRTEGPK